MITKIRTNGSSDTIMSVPPEAAPWANAGEINIRSPRCLATLGAKGAAKRLNLC